MTAPAAPGTGADRDRIEALLDEALAATFVALALKPARRGPDPHATLTAIRFGVPGSSLGSSTLSTPSL